MTSIGKYRWIPWKWKGGNEYFSSENADSHRVVSQDYSHQRDLAQLNSGFMQVTQVFTPSHLHTLQLRGQKDMSSVLFSWMLDFLFGSVAGPSRIIQVKKKPRNSVLLMTWAKQRAVWAGRRKSDLDYKLQGKYLHSNILGNLRKCLCKHV